MNIQWQESKGSVTARISVRGCELVFIVQDSAYIFRVIPIDSVVGFRTILLDSRRSNCCDGGGHSLYTSTTITVLIYELRTCFLSVNFGLRAMDSADSCGDSKIPAMIPLNIPDSTGILPKIL